MALAPEEVVLLDWNLATRGPAALDFLMFAIGSASHVDASREDLVAARAELALQCVPGLVAP